ncbi:hypothetical protein DMA12_27145 [Amycolatopsis balhimycina DSM 5908]|uniref:SnoaL-like domain-containing protein n=1 Tax=Amycolatopsis balhimycina DSM 5908 TaxID=1081091 RepID=A0A428WB89_AMYBA|nr:nuclear transport factor 2 family protein [Amycolatopsis balhimycina]RSM40360.1 hypothetical protein DMA12_27145 [Amycolatopsis balhimycina DSM 5908]
MAVTDERRARLAANLNKLRAYHEIQNEMGRVVAAVNFGQPDKVLARFALGRPDVSVEWADEGVFIGPEAVTTIVRETIGRERAPGEMVDLQLTTPMIEVADDQRSAEALWWCPGAGTLVEGTDEPEAIWLWGTLAADFVPDGGTWKIWHLHYFRYIKCHYDRGWTDDTSLINRPNVPMHPLAKPTTHHNPYSPLSIRDGLPAAPRPHRTYEGIGWMLNRDKTH